MVQRHEFSVELGAPPDEVWEVFWYRAPDRPPPKDVQTRLDILHPAAAAGNGDRRDTAADKCFQPA